MGNTNCILSKEVAVVNELGLHARAAAKIAELAQNAKSKVWIQKDDEKVDAKSIIDILTLACGRGSTIQIIIEDAADTLILDSIVRLTMHGFGE
jgi:phosphocarrier protein HPr